MNRINNNKNRNKNKRLKIKEKEEDVIEDISIKSSKKLTKTSEKNIKNKKELQKEKKILKKEKRKHSIKKFFLKTILLLILLLILVGIIFYIKTQENGGGIKGALITALGLSLEEIESLDTINVLILGISEDIDSKLTDTIILCSYNPKNQVASIISIPRDTFIGNNENNATGNDKINSLYNKNPDKLLKVVSKILGVNVDNYVVVNTDTLIKIIDIIGEVKFEVPIDMNYDDPTQNLHIHLKKGVQKIDGEEAEQLLRFRHNNDGTSYPGNYGDNDFGRMKTQRNFIKETIKQTIHVKNIFKIPIIINTIFDNIEANFELEILLSYIPTLIDFNMECMLSNQLPGESKKCNNLWFFVYDKKETENLINSLEIINKN